MGYRLERHFAVIVLFLSAGPFFDLLYTKPYGGAIAQLCWAALYVVAVTLLTLRFKGYWVAWTARRMSAVIVVLGVALLSCAWSLEPSLTLRRSVSLIGTSLIGVYLGMSFPPSDLIRIIFRTCIIIVVLSSVTAVAAPRYGTMDFITFDSLPDAWKGIVHHKQVLGAIAAYGAVICLAMMMTRRAHSRVLWLGMLSLFAFGVVMAKSATALGALFIATTVVISLAALRRLQFPFAWVFILMMYAACASAFLATQDLSYFTELLGRDPTLTGRVSTWRDAMGMIADRPFIGFGYEAVWGGDSGNQLLEFLRATRASHAHNGYLNLATQIGLPATLIAVGFLVVTIYRAVRGYFLEQSTFLTFSVGYLLLFAVMNMVGSTLFDYQEFEWVLFMAVAVMVTRIATGSGPLSRTTMRTTNLGVR